MGNHGSVLLSLLSVLGVPVQRLSLAPLPGRKRPLKPGLNVATTFYPMREGNGNRIRRTRWCHRNHAVATQVLVKVDGVWSKY